MTRYLLTVFAWLVGFSWVVGQVVAWGTQPEIVQVLSNFHRPESVAFSLDGRTLYVSNCGSDVFGPDRSFVGFVAGNGCISQVAIAEDGSATVTKQKWIDGLSGNLGIAVLPKATTRFPEGTLLVNQGISLLVNQEGKSITDAEQLGTGILFLDAETGEELGKIDLGVGSRVADVLGHVTLLPNSIAFDGDGNLYVTDTAKGGDRLQAPIDPNPGLIRVTHEAIDLLVDGEINAKDAVTFTPMDGVPNGVGYWEARRSLCVVTMGGTSPEGTAVYVMDEDSFPRDDLPAPLRGDVGTADGIAFTPAGTMVTSRFAGDLLAIPQQGEPFALDLDPFVAPADHRLKVLQDGSCLLAVPEQDRKDPKPWSQNVKLIRLPPGF
ncbi:MAG: hypothetical protein AAGD07_20010 [Planctomycetota bacterium]